MQDRRQHQSPDDRRASVNGDVTAAQALRMRRFLIALATYVLAIVTMALGAWFELWGFGGVLKCAILVGCVNLAFFALLRSGANLKLADPSLTVEQIAAGIGVLLLATYYAGVARSALTLWVIMIFLFAVFRLRAKQLWPLAIVTWLAFGTISWVSYHDNPSLFNPRLEVFLWLVLGSALAWFSLMGGYISNMRARMRRNEIFYRSMWETVHDAILIAGSKGKIEYANPAVSAVFGRDPQSLLGTLVTALLAQQTAPDAQELQCHLEGSEVQRDWNAVELAFTRADGTPFPAEVSVDDMVVDRRRAYLLSVRDVSARAVRIDKPRRAA